MRGIAFDYSSPISDAVPTRMDVACFVGFVSRKKGGLLPASLTAWWEKAGYEGSGDDVTHRPVPIESWEAFKAIFDDQRMVYQAQVRSRHLTDPLSISADDGHLHLIVDGMARDIVLPQGDGSVLPAALVEHLNKSFRGQLDERVEARLDTRPEWTHIVLKRTALQTAGELTVYPNPSLGFPKSVQSDDARQENYLAAAVRAFFRQGGRKCYVISMGDPLPYFFREAERYQKILQLFWGDTLDSGLGPENSQTLDRLRDIYLPGLTDNIQEMSRRRGLTCLIDLVDVTYLCMPDLAELFAARTDPLTPRPKKTTPEVFVACSQEETVAPWHYFQTHPIPRLSRVGYGVWKRFVDLLLGFLAGHAPTMQLVASLPLPSIETAEAFESFVSTKLFGANARADDRYRRLQLAFPWLKTRSSSALPGSAEPPEGTLLGLLANGALTQGAYRSIAGSLIHHAYDLLPLDIDAYTQFSDTGMSMHNRISIFDRVPSGIGLQSDVTAARDMASRYAVVRRIMILVQKTAQVIGMRFVFETSNQRVWKAIEDAMAGMLTKVFQKNGLRGASPKEAFSVTCNRSTMTQQDIDNGRFIVHISLQPAVPIERITINMMIDRSGLTMTL